MPREDEKVVNPTDDFTKKVEEELRSYRDAGFTVKVYNLDSHWKIYPDEAEVTITYNSHQYMVFSLNNGYKHKSSNKDWESTAELRLTDIMNKNPKISINEICNKLPRMPWSIVTWEKHYLEKTYGDELPVNSGKRWSLKDTTKLKEYWDNLGIGDEILWKEAADSLGRTLSGVEHQLRLFWVEETYQLVLKKRNNLTK